MMFTLEQIHEAHKKVKSGSDFPFYIKEIKAFGVTAFVTWVKDSHTEYFGADHERISSSAVYTALSIAGASNKLQFQHYLKMHQQGKTDYYTFCKHCAETGIEKWHVSLDEMTCIYYDKSENEILIENIPVV